MAFDTTKPATTDNYSTAFTQNIQANFTALAQWLDSTNTTITGTPPPFAKRYNTSSGRIEQYSTSWLPITLTATTADTATTAGSTGLVTLSSDTSSATVCYPIFSGFATGSLSLKTTSTTKLSFVPSTGILTATGFTGSGSGLTAVPVTALTGTLPLANGGTGATTAATALVTLGERTSNTGSILAPVGTTAQRDASPAAGYLRYNTTTISFEGYNGTNWTPVGGAAKGGGTDDVFYENSATINTSYTISTNKNAMSAGPITIANGVTVTIPDGSTWSII